MDVDQVRDRGVGSRVDVALMVQTVPKLRPGLLDGQSGFKPAQCGQAGDRIVFVARPRADSISDRLRLALSS